MDAQAARATIERIVRGAEEGFLEGRGWPLHPNDSKTPTPHHGLYLGDSGVIWSLRYLQRRGIATRPRDWISHLTALRVDAEHGSYLFGETPITMMLRDRDERLVALIEGTMHHPARELMWGAPGTMLAALFLHRRSGGGPWLDLYRRFGDSRWLDRARAFAMHGIAQTLADHATFGQWRHGLWTGDLGFAIYLLDCIEEVDAFPTLDVFD